MNRCIRSVMGGWLYGAPSLIVSCYKRKFSLHEWRVRKGPHRLTQWGWCPTEIIPISSPFAGRERGECTCSVWFLRKYSFLLRNWEKACTLQPESPATSEGQWKIITCFILNFVMTFRSFAYKSPCGDLAFVLRMWQLSCQCLDKLCFINQSD